MRVGGGWQEITEFIKRHPELGLEGVASLLVEITLTSHRKLSGKAGLKLPSTPKGGSVALTADALQRFAAQSHLAAQSPEP